MKASSLKFGLSSTSDNIKVSGHLGKVTYVKAKIEPKIVDVKPVFPGNRKVIF